VRAAARRDASGSFVVRLETPGEGSTQARELRGATCKAVADAAALILALMIDPDAAARDDEAPSETNEPDKAGADRSDAAAKNPENQAPPIAPQAGTAPPASPAPPSSPTPRPPQEPAPRAPAGSAQPIELRLSAWAGADIGSLPGLAPGFGALASIGFGAPRVAVGIAFWPDKSGFLEDLSSAGSDVGLLAGELGICGALLQKPIEIAPCAAVEIGELYATGFGVVNPRRGGAVWVALKGGGALVWRPLKAPFAGLGLTARIEAVIPLVRPRFVIEKVGPVHSPAYVAGRGALGVEISL
jgi:hypothetical protein